MSSSAMTNCHLCGADLADAITVGTTGRHGDECHEVACARCGLVQRRELPTEAELAAYYDGPYRAKFVREPVRDQHGRLHEWGSPEAERLLDEGAAEYAAHIAETLGLTRESCVLEVGCGDGRLSAALGKLCSCDALEADAGMVREAARRGVLAFQLSLADLAEQGPGGPGEDDAIVSCHVLEHFRDPLESLAQMRSILRNGGRVWLEVPNVDKPYGDLDTHYWQWPHLYNFSAHTLALLLMRAGFDDVHVRDGGHVLLAYATSGDTAPMNYDRAHARLQASTGGTMVPTGADVAERLDEYRRQWRERTRTERAVTVLQAFRAGANDVDIDALRDALELLGDQSVRAARMAERAMADGAALVELCDRAISVAEGYDADPWLLGYRAGEASMAARMSHAVGNAVNAWKLIEASE